MREHKAYSFFLKFLTTNIAAHQVNSTLSCCQFPATYVGVVVRKGRCQLRCRSRHLTMVQTVEVRRQKPSFIWIVQRQYSLAHSPSNICQTRAAETSRIIGRSVSAETVRNVIRHAGYNSRVARKKPFISLQNQKKHLEFAKTHQLKTDNFWKKVIFSDESKFNIFGSDGRRTVWRKPNTVLDPKNSRPTVKHSGGSVMVWGCRASNGVGNLVFIDGIMMDHKLYIDILNNNLKESAKKLGLDGDFIFQQDNDSKHTARNVKI
ncbi:transposable element Tcb1 transposase [Trichonephila clavipes]|nr:transposable element Tcb1 transposase [Trichonephila clavipes]